MISQETRYLRLGSELLPTRAAQRKGGKEGKGVRDERTERWEAR